MLKDEFFASLQLSSADTYLDIDLEKEYQPEFVSYLMAKAKTDSLAFKDLESGLTRVRRRGLPLLFPPVRVAGHRNVRDEHLDSARHEVQQLRLSGPKRLQHRLLGLPNRPGLVRDALQSRHGPQPPALPRAPDSLHGPFALSGLQR